MTTILGGIRDKLNAQQVSYVRGCAIRDTTTSNISAVVTAARDADVIIAVVGGSSARDFKTSYKETGAADATQQTLQDIDCGEGFDRATLIRGSCSKHSRQPANRSWWYTSRDARWIRVGQRSMLTPYSRLTIPVRKEERLLPTCSSETTTPPADCPCRFR